jgi:hypothetical protein
MQLDDGTGTGGLAERQARELEAHFPGWRAWRSAQGGQWHARQSGTEPPVLVHDDDPAGLAEQIRELRPLAARLEVPGG